MSSRDSQRLYFDRARYRAADHPAVRAYAEPKLAHLFTRMEPEPPGSVLDVACGNGVFSRPLSSGRANLTCLDLSFRMLEDNRWGERCQGDALALPFRSDAFDLVFAANLLHHVDAPLLVLAELKRVSRRWVALVEPHVLNPLMAAFVAFHPAERAAVRFTASHVRDLVTASGLCVHDHLTTGMITQNWTPAFLAPLLAAFDGPCRFGMYQVVLARLPARAAEQQADEQP